MRKTLNYTGRIDLLPEDYSVHANIEDGELYVSVPRLNLSDSVYPGKADVTLELWSQGVSRVRVPMGTVAELELPDYTKIEALKNAKTVNASIKVTDEEGKILGHCIELGIHLVGDTGIKKKGILGVAINPDPMGAIWKLVWMDDAPVLYMNRELDDPFATASSPSFRATVVPEVVRRVAERQIALESAEGANPLCKKFLDNLLSEMPNDEYSLAVLARYYMDKDHEMVEQALDQICDHFAKKSSYLERFLASNGDDGND